MQNIIWDKPVAANGTLVFGPAEASRLLSEHHFYKNDLHFEAANACIQSVLDGAGCPDEARELFEVTVLSAEFLGNQTAGTN